MPTLKQKERATETDRAALEIITAQTTAREAKTARLRAARLAMEEEQAKDAWKAIGRGSKSN